MNELEESTQILYDFDTKVKELYEEAQRELESSKLFDRVSRLFRDKKFKPHPKIKKEQDATEETVSVIVNQINSKYPNRLSSFINAPGPRENEPYLTLILKCPSHFHSSNAIHSHTEANLASAEEEIRKCFNDDIFLFPGEEVDIDTKVNKTNSIIAMMKEMFDKDLDRYNRYILDKLIEDQAIQNGLDMRKYTPDRCFFNNYTYKKLQKPYYEFHFEDLVLVMLKMLSFLTNLNIKLEVDLDEKLLIKLWAEEYSYEVLAEKEEYLLQLKPYALRYGQFKEQLEDKKEDLLHKEQLVELLHPAGFDQYNIDELMEKEENLARNYPPHLAYEKKKNLKFMRYDAADECIQVEDDPEFCYESNPEGELAQDNKKVRISGQASLFRNIDKIRLVEKSLANNLDLEFLNANKIFDSVVFVRNFKGYESDLAASQMVLGTISCGKTEKLVRKVRDYFGEKVGYYFLWTSHYSSWLIFPMVIGIIAFIVSQWKEPLDSYKLNFIEKKSLSNYTIVEFTFCFFLTVWASMFLKMWKQKEKKYAYLWGMEGYEVTEPYRREYEVETKVDFIFDNQLLVQNQSRKNLRMFLSYIVILVICCIDMLLVYLLFVWKEKEEKKKAASTGLDYKNLHFYTPYAVATLNGIQIKVFSVIYDYIATALTRWENHEKETQFSNHLTLKIVFFEFVNNYTSLFYISFLKGYMADTGCAGDDCMGELSTQIYIILLTIVIFNILEVLIPALNYAFARRMYRSLVKTRAHQPEEFKIGSIHHELFCDEFSTLRNDYNELLILFGYVVFFSISAPLTPLIVYCIIHLEQLVDFYKLVKLSRVTIIEGSTGIEIYNKVFKVFYYMGMLTNIALILFTSKALEDTSKFMKVIYFLVLENSFLFINYMVNFNILPSWYDNIPLIKALYHKKYFVRDTDNLPHNQLIVKTIKRKEEELYGGAVTESHFEDDAETVNLLEKSYTVQDRFFLRPSASFSAR